MEAVGNMQTLCHISGTWQQFHCSFEVQMTVSVSSKNLFSSVSYISFQQNINVDLKLLLIQNNLCNMFRVS
jgi:hypothetical protein